MEALIKHTGIAAPLDRKNVDTDMIIPKQFLKEIKRTGFGKHLFHELRYRDYDGTQENPEFILNQDPYRSATVLVARENFGCGSSREHAPWALADFGFRVVIAPSFADIFYNNCSKNGILLIRLKDSEVDQIFEALKAHPGIAITADLENQKVSLPDGTQFDFEIPAFFKECLLKGLDQIGWTQQFSEKIDDYEKDLKNKRPWVA